MRTLHTVILSFLSLALLARPAFAAPDKFVDVLELPAKHSEIAQHSLLIDVTNAGNRLIAVGQRGHIVYSDDQGHTWHQSVVPVSSDLTAVSFPTPQQGWAVGHDGVVLNSTDGGLTWVKQLDGRQIGSLMLNYYIAQASTYPGETRYLELIDESRRLISEGADKPFLDVWFENANNGYIVGAFNLIFRTNDGGQTWIPQQHLVDNPYVYHLNAITQSGGHLYIAGEQGLLLKQGTDLGQFAALPSPYEGSFFGLLDNKTQLIAYGLRGHAFSTSDGGNTWTTIETGTSASLTAAARDAQGHLYLFCQDGQALISNDDGFSFVPLPWNTLPVITGATAEDNGDLVLVGSWGIRFVKPNNENTRTKAMTNG